MADRLSGPVGAVIVTYNRLDLLEECLRAVLGQMRPPEAVVLVDNASTDGTPQMVAERFPAVEVLALPQNVGGAGDRGVGHAASVVLEGDPRPLARLARRCPPPRPCRACCAAP